MTMCLFFSCAKSTRARTCTLLELWKVSKVRRRGASGTSDGDIPWLDLRLLTWESNITS